MPPDPTLDGAYGTAWEEWATAGEADLWDEVVADGLDPSADTPPERPAG